MSIELHFLQKAIKDRNYVSFSYEGERYKKVKPLSIEDELLKCDVGKFNINSVKKITVLKDRY